MEHPEYSKFREKSFFRGFKKTLKAKGVEEKMILDIARIHYHGHFRRKILIMSTVS